MPPSSEAWGCTGKERSIIRKTCKRYNIPGHAHALTFSCYKRRPFLTSELACSHLADAIQKARDKHRFHLWAYVFMPEHVHLVLWPCTETYVISIIPQTIKQSASRRVLLHLRKHSPNGLSLLSTGRADRPFCFWQEGGGYDRNITSVRILVETIRYVHDNPVRRGLAQDAVSWPWSSARQWLGTGSGPVPLDLDSLAHV